MLVLTDTPEHCLIVMLDPCLGPSSHTECTVIVCMLFGTVFSSLGHNYQIHRYHYLEDLSSSDCSYCGIMQCYICLDTQVWREFSIFLDRFPPPHNSALKNCISLAVFCM